MGDFPHISQVHFTAATDADIARGLLGYVRLVVNGLVIDSLALRRTLGGQLTLTYPARTDARGRRHFVARPVDNDARRAIEAGVFAALHLAREAAP